MWLQRAEVVIYVLLFTCLSTGLVYLWHAAVEVELFRVALGAAVFFGGLAVALLMLALVRIGTLVVRNTQSLEEIGERVGNLETMLEAALEPEAEPESQELDLAGVGVGDPEPLVAAQVTEDGFPRFVAPPELAANPADAVPTRRQDGRSSNRPGRPSAADDPSQATPTDGTKPAVRRMETCWQEAFDRRDISACRRILAESGSAVDPQRRSALSQALEVLVSQKKQALRESFAASFRAGRLREALARGREIVTLFPDSPMAQEFLQIEPHLLARAADEEARHAGGEPGAAV
jgi:hypothetical protein